MAGATASVSKTGGGDDNDKLPMCYTCKKSVTDYKCAQCHAPICASEKRCLACDRYKMSQRIDVLEKQINELMKTLQKIKVVCPNCKGEGITNDTQPDMSSCEDCNRSGRISLLNPCAQETDDDSATKN